MTACFGALNDNDIDASVLKGRRLFWGRRRAHQGDAIETVERRNAESEAECRHLLLRHDCKLVFYRPAMW